MKKDNDKKDERCKGRFKCRDNKYYNSDCRACWLSRNKGHIK